MRAKDTKGKLRDKEENMPKFNCAQIRATAT